MNSIKERAGNGGQRDLVPHSVSSATAPARSSIENARATEAAAMLFLIPFFVRGGPCPLVY
jgi:hypothetical protein